MQTNRCSFSKKTLVGMLVLAMTAAMGFPSEGWAMIAPPQLSGDAAEVGDARATDLKTIQTALESKVLRQRLMELKLTPEQINARMSRLSDAQVHQAAAQIRTVSPGGDGGLGTVVTILVIGVLVVLFMYLFKRV
jgi:hypothetical protein